MLGATARISMLVLATLCERNCFCDAINWQGCQLAQLGLGPGKSTMSGAECNCFSSSRNGYDISPLNLLLATQTLADALCPINTSAFVQVHKPAPRALKNWAAFSMKACCNN